MSPFRWLAVVGVALLMLLTALSAEASCAPRKTLTFSDGAKACIDDYPLSQRRAPGQLATLSQTFRQNSHLVLALPSRPARCAPAMGIDYGSPGHFLPQATPLEREAIALRHCQSSVGPATSDCTCEVVVFDGRVVLDRADFERRMEDALQAGQQPARTVAETAPAAPVTAAPALAARPPAEAPGANLAASPSVTQAPANTSNPELAALREQLLALQAQVNQRPPPTPAPATFKGRARALVIGNGRYASMGALPNPGNDARAIAAKLRSFGIEVDLVLDADRAALVRALAEYQRAASGIDLNILFYAGHGIQVDGVNYIVPVEMAAEGASAGSVKLNAVSLNDAMEYLPARTRLVFLDACRDNPLSRSLRLSRSSSSLGLAPVQASSGTLVAYATKDGSTAEDGRGRHSPYTEALLAHLDAPDDIAIVLRRVRQSVLTATGQRQEPWEYGSLIGDALVLSRVAR